MIAKVRPDLLKYAQTDVRCTIQFRVEDQTFRKNKYKDTELEKMRMLKWITKTIKDSQDACYCANSN